MSFYLAIISPTDSPLFETTFQTSRGQPTNHSQSQSQSQSSSGAFPTWSSFTSPSGADLGPATPGALPLGGGGPGSGGGGNGPGMGGPGGGFSGERSMMQMIVHKSLDSVDEVVETTGGLYLKNVDRHNEYTVSAFIAGNVRFMLLHDVKNEDGIRLFFLDVWEAYVKILLNPFHTSATQIRNPAFEARIRSSAKRNL